MSNETKCPAGQNVKYWDVLSRWTFRLLGHRVGHSDHTRNCQTGGNDSGKLEVALGIGRGKTLPDSAAPKMSNPVW